MRMSNANGVKGCLIWVQSGLNSRYMFRVYHPEDKSKFHDYEMHHYDLQIIIDDEDAEFKLTEDGEWILDHSDKTLGRE